VNTPSEWREVLDAALAGNGSLELLQNRGQLATRLELPDPAVRRQVIDQLAAQNEPEAWALISRCLNDPKTRNHAIGEILSARYLPLFADVFEAEEKARSPNSWLSDPVRYVPSVFNDIIRDLTTEEIRTLLAQQRPHAEKISFAAIRHQHRFEFLDEIVAILNQRPSETAVATVESLLQGPCPDSLKPSTNGKSAKDPWTSLIEDRNNGVLGRIAFKGNGKRTDSIPVELVRLALQRDPANWPQMCELRREWILNGGSEWQSVAFAQAMAETDRAKTLDLLANELDPRDNLSARTAATLAGLGVIADQSSAPHLEAFRQKSKGGLFEKHAYYRKYLAFALHRCRQIHQWKLVQHADSSYSIEKPGKPLEAGK
jgi:hypothetical protein